MSEETKVIGFRQKVPYRVLEGALYRLLSGEKLETSELSKDLQEHFSGANRISKAITTVNLILNKNEPVLNKLRKILTSDSFLNLSETDRKVLILCLLCLSYPIAYDSLVIAATIFKLQDCISRDVLHQKLGSIYGSNRAVYIAIGELLPTFIELDLFTREKKSVYQKSPSKPIFNNRIAELFIYTDIKLSNSKSILAEDIDYRPWFSYYEVNFHQEMPSKFIIHSDSVIGGGYLTAR